MAKKLRGIDKAKRENKTVGLVRDSAHQIWLAGLGAFAKAQEEGGKLFESLVEEGEKIEARTKQAAEDTVSEVKGRVQEMTGKASEGLDKIEHVFEERVARALNGLGVPTRDDVAELTRRVEALNDQIVSLRVSAKQSSGAKRAEDVARDGDA